MITKTHLLNSSNTGYAEREQAYERDGIEIVNHIYEYLTIDVVHNKSPFTK